MAEAIVEAKKAFAKNEVPIGAVIVFNEKVIARGHNLIEKNCDASCHAELICLQRAAKILGNWRLLESTLYCTLEPCAMCAGAMSLFRIKRLVYGASDLRHGANGSVFQVLNCPHPIHQVDVTSGICEQESRELMQKFFRQRRGDIGRNI